MPKKNKFSGTATFLTLRSQVFTKLPGLVAAEELLLRSTELMFCIKDQESRYIAVNDKFLRTTRLPRKEDILGKTAREIFPPSLAAGYEQQDAQVFREGREVRDRLEVISDAHGNLGWYLTDKIPVKDLQGTIVVLVSTSRDLHLPTRDDPRLGRLGATIAEMQARCTQTLRISELALKAGMSQSRFERLMKQVLSVSPRQLLTRLRIDEAARRLRESKEPLGEVALNCGFYDQPTFCRQFRSLLGMSPLAYRLLNG